MRNQNQTDIPVKTPVQSASGQASATQVSDDDLLARIKNDDRAAYKMLVERYLPKLWRLSVSVLYNEAEAEDVVQDTLLTVWQNRHKWEDGDAKFSTWIYRVTLNRSIDVKRKRRPTTGIEMVEDTMPSEALLAADQLLVRREDHAHLNRLLNTLPENQKAAILLYYCEELNIKEISTKLATTEQGARSLLKRGRKALRDMLDREPEQFQHRGFQGTP